MWVDKLHHSIQSTGSVSPHFPSKAFLFLLLLFNCKLMCAKTFQGICNTQVYALQIGGGGAQQTKVRTLPKSNSTSMDQGSSLELLTVIPRVKGDLKKQG